MSLVRRERDTFSAVHKSNCRGTSFSCTRLTDCLFCAQIIECLGVILSAWFSFSIAHFGPIEAFCAFLAVATHRICQPRQESLFERNAAG